MNKSLLTVLVLFIATLCNASLIDDKLQPYVDDFVSDASKAGIKTDTSFLVVKFGDLTNEDIKNKKPNNKIVGLCSYIGNPTITIDQGSWENYKPMQQKFLMYHELGHCLLGRGHCDVKKGSPKLSIMDSYTSSEEDYVSNYKWYIEEMFHASENCIDDDK